MIKSGKKIIIGAFFIVLIFCEITLADNLVKDIRISESAESSRIVIDIQKAPSSKVFHLQNPERVVVDISNAKLANNFKSSKLTGKLVRGIRFSNRGKILRIVFDLDGRIKHKYFTLPKSGKSDHRLVIDLEKFNSSAERSNISPKKSQGRKIIVVIDPGHGGKDPGAIGPNGTRESNVVLEISLKLADYFNKTNDMQAILSRNDNTFIPLRERMEIAREYNADLFLSIHADALNNSRVKGASVYTLSLKGASDEASKILAKGQNEGSTIGEVDIAGMDKDAISLLTDLSQNSSMEASKEVGAIILNQLSKAVSIRKKKVQEAGFLVLKSPDVPSVLIETTFISNPGEEAKLNTRRFQDRLAEAIFQGARNYFLINPPQDTILSNNINSDTQIISYIVKRGDTLSEIAELYNVKLSLIKNFNGISGSTIRIGQSLQIPLYQ
jgi:N-acetylmuramoyl-L-alanine amidase